MPVTSRSARQVGRPILMEQACFRLPVLLQDIIRSGNYPTSMAETTLAPGLTGPMKEQAVLQVDWAAELARHDRWLRTIVHARLGEPQAVCEVMQEIALAAVAQQAPLHDQSRIAAWLYRMAIRQVLMYRRKRGRQRKLVNGYARGQIGSGGALQIREPLDWLLQVERHGRVRLALERLPRRDAEILLLKYSENWSYRVLAAHLGTSESAVEARLHRARARLREALGGAAESEGMP
jgi:RNA polymerase sigma factor (sigma-70 family)